MRSIVLDTRPLRVSRDFRDLWLGLSVSNLGAQLTVVAVGLQVYALTGSTPAVGLLGLAALVPLVVFGLYGGAIVDRYDRRRVALISGVAGWLAVLGLLAQALVGNTHVEVLYVLVALESAANAVTSPARSAIIPRLVPAELMAGANALSTLGWNVALTVGPLLGAVLVAGGGYAVAYGADAVLFTFALVALLRLPPIPPEPGAPKTTGLRSVRDGLVYLAGQPNLRMTFIVDIIAMMTAMPRVLFPAVGLMFLGGAATTTGALTAAIAAGGVLAGVLSGGLTRLRWQGRIITWAITGWGAAVAAFGLVLVVVGPTRPDGVLPLALAAAMAALLVAGASDAISQVFRMTILVTAVPDAFRGRLQGISTVVVAGGPRLGELLLGAVAGRVGEQWAALLGGLVCVAALWLVVGVQRTFWRYDARNPTP
ncbi:MAG: MFS transporter [Actinobacteria bacterium]|nr:MFS transporter [Actinomycetota bacterium]